MNTAYCIDGLQGDPEEYTYYIIMFSAWEYNTSPESGTMAVVVVIVIVW